MNNAKVGFQLYNGADGSISGSVTIMDSVFGNIVESAIEIAVSKDVADSGFTGLIIYNVHIAAKIKDLWSSAQILAAGYFKSVRILSLQTLNILHNG